MRLFEIISPDSIVIRSHFINASEAIEVLTNTLCSLGKINNKGQFIDSVFAREAQGPTALGEGLAVPHGKSDAVIEPCVAVAILDKPLKWVGIEGEEDVEIIVLLGIPTVHQGDMHILLLSELTSLLIDDDFREEIKKANTPQELLEKIKTASI